MKFFYRFISYPLAFLGLMLGFSSKVMAQYGVMVMHFKFVGEIKSAVCEQNIEGIEVIMVNEANGNKTAVRTDENGQFNFLIRERFYDTEYTLNIADIDGDKNMGEFVSKTVNFRLNENSDGFAYAHEWVFSDDKKEVKPLKIYLDYKYENPCLELQNSGDEEEIEPILENEKVENEIDQENSEDEDNNPFANFKNAILYPNPNDGNFKVEFFSSVQTKSRVSIFDINASLIDSFEMFTNLGFNVIDLKYNYLAPGQYVLLIRVENEEKSFKIIVN